MTYYNTTAETGDRLKDSETKTGTQTDRILSYFKSRPTGLFSPADIQDRVLPGAPLTSVRRAMTDLTADGLLRKTGRLVPGKFGKLNYCWKLAAAPVQLSLF
ncbi:MAG: hypothetical protein GY841_12365 [FCB group bacterium]|nr:hypothetical protein [FCB group bacterium]